MDRLRVGPDLAIVTRVVGWLVPSGGGAEFLQCAHGRRFRPQVFEKLSWLKTLPEASGIGSSVPDCSASLCWPVWPRVRGLRLSSMVSSQKQRTIIDRGSGNVRNAAVGLTGKRTRRATKCTSRSSRSGPGGPLAPVRQCVDCGVACAWQSARERRVPARVVAPNGAR